MLNYYIKNNTFLNFAEESGQRGFFVILEDNENEILFANGKFAAAIYLIASRDMKKLQNSNISIDTIKELLKLQIITDKQMPAQQFDFSMSALELEELITCSNSTIKPTNFQLNFDEINNFFENDKSDSEPISVYALACCSSSGASRGS